MFTNNECINNVFRINYLDQINVKRYTEFKDVYTDKVLASKLRTVTCIYILCNKISVDIKISPIRCIANPKIPM